eukprot:TRINITY_DN5643_c0_g3_i1.p1 TRINITY_DN5643_c0_g3~~TRINITY_DN5643_c0_g3_i1.p1  ORF type:complete len:381 (-),score=149.14 TRINITY_DN5643_c0_g3_i1:144-1286(-)
MGALIVIFGVLAGTFAVVPTEKQGTIESLAEMDAVMAKLQDSRFGALLNSFLQMSVPQQQARDLYEGFDQIIESLKRLIKEEDDNFKQNLKSYRSVKGVMKSAVDDYTRKVNLGKQRLEQELKPNRKMFEDTVASTETDIITTKNQLTKLESGQQKAEKEYKDQRQQLDKLIAAIDKAIEVLQTADKQQQQQPAMVETRVESFRQRITEISNGVKAVKGYPYKPLVHALVMISQRGDFSTQESIAKIVGLLNKLRSQLTAQLEELDKSNQDANRSFQETKKAQEEMVKTLTVKLRRTQRQLTRTYAEISQLENSLKELEATLQKWTDSLQGLEDYWSKMTEQHNKVLQDFNDEIALVKKAIQVCEQNGISRPPAAPKKAL